MQETGDSYRPRIGVTVSLALHSDHILTPPVDTDGVSVPSQTISDLSVLLADGDATTRSVLNRCLGRNWSTLLVSSTADEAWQIFLQNDRCQIVVLDWTLRLTDGRALVDAIRAVPRQTYTYVIVTIKNPSRADTRSAMQSGADDVLAKPFFYETLDQRMLVAQRMLRLEARLLERQMELQAANTRIESINERTLRELTAAADMQRSLLPGDLSHLERVAVAWRYAPSTELGGDLIGCAPLGEHHLGFYVLDVSGHGVTAALLAVQAHRFLSSSEMIGDILHEADGSPSAPSAVVERLNERFPMSTRNQYFTIVYGHLDMRSGMATWCCAGHPWPLLADQHGANQIAMRGSPAVGWLPTTRARFFDHQLVLKPQESLLFFSDGAVEAINRERAQFEIERLAALSGGTSAPACILDSIITHLDRWIVDAPEQDDISLLMIRFTPPVAD
jgi:sigma-B regulation protein RsbU (phosphoserine phosphatase)